MASSITILTPSGETVTIAGEDGAGVPVGGITGQVLAKATGTDFATEWIDPPTGDVSSLVPKTTTVNGHALSGDVSVTLGDVGGEAAGTAATGDAAHLAAYQHGDISHTNRAALDQVSGVNTGDQNLSGLAPLASPALTGAPTAPTAAPGTNTTQLATTAYVGTAVSALVGTTPATLDTLKELADAIGDDPNYAATVAALIGGKEPAITAGTTLQYLRGDKTLSTFATDALAAAPAETATTIGAILMGAAAKTTPVDADMVALMDSGVGSALKMLSWANIKATLKTYFDSLYQGLLPIHDNTGASVDYALAVGETAKITYSAATSVPLRITTVEGVYEISIIGDSTVTIGTGGTVGLRPNNATVSAGTIDFGVLEMTWTRTQAAGSVAVGNYADGTTLTAFPVGWDLCVKSNISVSTFTKSKVVGYAAIRINSSTVYFISNGDSYWTDTTTAWASLGTLTFPFSQSGTIIVKRVL